MICFELFIVLLIMVIVKIFINMSKNRNIVIKIIVRFEIFCRGIFVMW